MLEKILAGQDSVKCWNEDEIRELDRLIAADDAWTVADDKTIEAEVEINDNRYGSMTIYIDIASDSLDLDLSLCAEQYFAANSYEEFYEDDEDLDEDECNVRAEELEATYNKHYSTISSGLKAISTFLEEYNVKDDQELSGKSDEILALLMDIFV